MKDNVLNDLVEIELSDSENFLKIKETLTRMGVSSPKSKSLYQSCHILHKQGKYYIVHFKELFKLDGKETTFSESDLSRRNTIVNLLAEWGLLKIVEPSKSQDPMIPLSQIKILSHAEKGNWNLVPKYEVGVRKGNRARKTAVAR